MTETKIVAAIKAASSPAESSWGVKYPEAWRELFEIYDIDLAMTIRKELDMEEKCTAKELSDKKIPVTDHWSPCKNTCHHKTHIEKNSFIKRYTCGCVIACVFGTDFIKNCTDDLESWNLTHFNYIMNVPSAVALFWLKRPLVPSKCIPVDKDVIYLGMTVDKVYCLIEKREQY